MKLYRIYTENKNREQLDGLISRWFSSYTVHQATGTWHGDQENSLVIEILADNCLRDAAARELCKAIKTTNQQYSVLLVMQDVKSELI